MKKYGILLAVVLALMLCGCREGEKSYKEGLLYRAEGDSICAEEKYRLAVSQGYDAEEVQAELMLVCAENGKKEEAVKYLENLKGTGNPVILGRIALCYDEMHDPDAAAEWYGKIRIGSEKKLSAEMLETLALRAEFYYRNGMYDSALEDCRRLITEGYHKAQYEIIAGLCYLNDGRSDAACQYFDMLLNCEDVSLRQYLYVGNVLTAAGEARASDYYGRGIAKAQNEGAEMSIGEFRYFAGQKELFLRDFKTGGSLRENLLAARLYAEQKDFGQAEEIYRSLFGRGENCGLLFNDYMVFQALRGDFDTALKQYTMTETDPDEDIRRKGAWNEIVIYENLADYKQALLKLDEYLKEYPEDEKARKEYVFLSRLQLNQE